MINNNFQNLNEDEKRTKLIRLIKQSVPIPHDRLLYLFSKLDFNKQYVIKAVQNSNRFKNMITQEYLIVDSEVVKSRVINLYGEFIPGYFEKINGVKGDCNNGSFNEKKPAAAIKQQITKKDKSSIMEYFLIIYEPKK